MKKSHYLFLLFLILASNLSGMSASSADPSNSIMGGEVLNVTFTFLNKSNIPLNNNNAFVDFFLELSDRKPVTTRYTKAFVILPEKSFTFYFSYPVPEDFFGKADYYFEVSSSDGKLYDSEKISVHVTKNAFYYRSKSFVTKYAEELKSWKRFSDNPESHFKDGTIFKKARADINKLLKTPESKEMMSSNDYHMLQVAKHRINFYLKYHPMPPEKIIEDDTMTTEAAVPDKPAEPVETVAFKRDRIKKFIDDIDHPADQPKSTVEDIESLKNKGNDPVDPKRPAEVDRPDNPADKTGQSSFFSTITSVLPDFSSTGKASQSPEVSVKTTDGKDPKVVVEVKTPVTVDPAKVDKAEPVAVTVDKTPDPAAGKLTAETASASTTDASGTEHTSTAAAATIEAVAATDLTGESSGGIKVKPLTDEAKPVKLVKKPEPKKKTNFFLLFAGILVVAVLAIRIVRKKGSQPQKATRLDDDFF